jgi:hypothetical protein
LSVSLYIKFQKQPLINATLAISPICIKYRW